jgi:hypothetical protein
MSMYGMVFGRSPLTFPILLSLGLTLEDVGRYRDAWVSEGEFAIYTRNGGGNREHWIDDDEPGLNCRCTGCTITYHLPQHPNYLRDRDDEFDSTYATVYFSIPDELKELFEPFDVGKVDTDQRWLDAIDALKGPS